MKKATKSNLRTNLPTEWIVVGKLSVARIDAGKFWLSHQHGEGMEVTEEKLAKVLEKFFWREF